MFESNVILNRFKTNTSISVSSDVFESNVILNRFKTLLCGTHQKV